jgi:diguanylate cyclase (GGDEF)-like protein
MLHANQEKDSFAWPKQVSNQLEFVQLCQDYFAAASTFKGVLKRLVEILDQFYGLTTAAYVVPGRERLTLEKNQAAIKFTPVISFSEEQLKKCRAQLAILECNDADFQGTISSLPLGSELVFAASFSDPSGSTGFLLWQQPNLNTGTPALSRVQHMEGFERPVLEFIVKSCVQAANWIRKLDRTQALLYQDEVTGLYNYRYLDVAIDSEIKRLQRFHSPFSLLFIDLDNFKQINDQHGHLTGSVVLKQVGEVIKLAVRDVDNVIRYGGDEFVVVLIGANSRQAMQAAERVRSRIEGARFRSEGHEVLNLTASIGVANCPEHGRDKKTILKLADETMYKSKKSGKNRVMQVDAARSTMDQGIVGNKTST